MIQERKKVSIIAALLSVLLAAFLSEAKPFSGSSEGTIIVVVEYPAGYKGRKGLLTTMEQFKLYHKRSIENMFNDLTTSSDGTTAKWVIKRNDPIAIRLPGDKRHINYYLEPGDSISVSLKETPIFYGRAASKFTLLYKLKDLNDSLDLTTWVRYDYNDKRPRLSPGYEKPNSLTDFRQWNEFLNVKLHLIETMLKEHKEILTPFLFEFLINQARIDIENVRLDKLHRLVSQTGMDSTKSPRINRYSLTERELNPIADSILDQPSIRTLTNGEIKQTSIGSFLYMYELIQAKRERGFLSFKKTDSVSSGDLEREKRDFMVYQRIKKRYRGANQEFGLKNVLLYNNSALSEYGMSVGMEVLVNDFLARPGYPEHRALVKEYVKIVQRQMTSLKAPPLTMEDDKGSKIRFEQLKGKVVVAFIEGLPIRSSKLSKAFFEEVQRDFKGTDIIKFAILSFERDRNEWLKSTQKMRKTKSVHLLYAGQKENDDIARILAERQNPIIILDPSGNQISWTPVVESSNTDRMKEGLVDLIKLQLTLAKDGPYIMNENNHVVSISLAGGQISKISLHDNSKHAIMAATDVYGENFEVTLNPVKKVEDVEYGRPSKLLALSDIEGEFSSFKQLLIKNKIMDAKFNWTFGDGHLVFAGDMFDRGYQVTECLWLVYRLEAQAKAAGGKVHFILGNHEVMNLQGDEGYVVDKYKTNAALLGKTIKELYSENSELGAWLRTKNVIEKVGDLLFMHGGFSEKLLETGLSLEEINQVARPNYDVRKQDYGNEKTNTVMSASYGPFWYRGYYDSQPAEMELIDSILMRFDVKKIVTGHTIVADQISTHYDGKVINTDVKHATGKSEALLIEGDQYYRVNAQGQKFPLFTQ